MIDIITTSTWLYDMYNRVLYHTRYVRYSYSAVYGTMLLLAVVAPEIIFHETAGIHPHDATNGRCLATARHALSTPSG